MGLWISEFFFVFFDAVELVFIILHLPGEFLCLQNSWGSQPLRNDSFWTIYPTLLPSCIKTKSVFLSFSGKRFCCLSFTFHLPFISVSCRFHYLSLPFHVLFISFSLCCQYLFISLHIFSKFKTMFLLCDFFYSG